MVKTYVEPKCKVCRSPNRADYERLRLETNASYMDILREVQKRKENLSWASVQRHFTGHVERQIDNQVQSDELISESVKRRLQETLKVVDQIHQDLSSARGLMADILKVNRDPDGANAVARLMKEVRDTMIAAMKLRHELDIGGQKSRDELIEELIVAYKDLDPASIDKIILRSGGAKGPDIEAE